MAGKILIADNEANLLISLEYLMQREGFTVCLASDGDEAWTQIREHMPDLVILDAMIPGRTGFDVCQQIRSEPSLCHVRVVMLSVKARETDIAKGKAMGADAYIVKPFSTSDLIGQVHRLLASTR